MTTGSKKSKKAADNAAAVVERIGSWPEPYRSMGVRLHGIVMDSSDLDPRPWYGMPGYARGAGPVLVFFRHDDYMTLGLTEKATFIEDGNPDGLKPSSWFFTELDPPTEARIAAIVRDATQD